MSLLETVTNSDHSSVSTRLQPSLAPSCPYSIQSLYSNANSSTYLIREHDTFGEFPNIYAKVYYKQPTRSPIVVILSDTGTGLDTTNRSTSLREKQNEPQHRPSPEAWNIAKYLSTVLNPRHAAPYVVITTHCHYDHICGIQSLINAKATITVLASSYDKSFVTPWANLQEHSLCGPLGLKAPKYDAHWVEDAQNITITGLDIDAMEHFPTSITVIHTPGHTPDSISWYDHDSYTLCVGDMFYEKESDETRSGSGGRWDREPPQPVIFPNEGSIIDWNASMHRLLDFVRYENRRLGTDTYQPRVSYRQDGTGHAVDFEDKASTEEDWSVIETFPQGRRVALCASHVTVGTDAEFALLEMLSFMLRIQLDQVPRIKVDDYQGNRDVWLWDDALNLQIRTSRHNHTFQSHQYSVRAPWSIIHRTTGQ